MLILSHLLTKRGGPKVLSVHARTLEEKKNLHGENEALVHNDNMSTTQIWMPCMVFT